MPVQVADQLIMGQRLSVAIRLSKMQDQTFLMLCWYSVLEGGSDNVRSIFGHKGGRYIDYRSMSMPSASSVHDARQEIVDATLTLIFRRW